MRTSRSLLVVCVTCAALLLAVGMPLAAQGDAPPETVPNADEAASLAEVIIAAVLASAFGTAPVTTFIVSLLKRLLTTVDARLITTVVALLLAAVTAAATQFGFDVQLESLLDLVATAGPAIVGFVATLVGSAGWYEAARRVNAPVVSYSRTPRL